MIHKTAIVDPKAKLADKVYIGPYSVIGPDVKIGEKTIRQFRERLKRRTRSF